MAATNQERKIAVSISFILLIVLILILLGVLPTWGHSRSWGMDPAEVSDSSS